MPVRRDIVVVMGQQFALLRFGILALAINITISAFVTLTPGCRPQTAESAVAPSREAAIAFASAVAALEVLDALHAQRMAAMTNPTPEQVTWATDFSGRLHSLRDVLTVVRSWLEGQATDSDGRAALHGAADVLQVMVDDLKSQGIAIPDSVSAGLAAAKYFV